MNVSCDVHYRLWLHSILNDVRVSLARVRVGSIVHGSEGSWPGPRWWPLAATPCSPQGEQGTYDEQRANAAAMAVSICALLDAGWRVVVVHGNGPQVGNLAIQQEMGAARCRRCRCSAWAP